MQNAAQREEPFPPNVGCATSFPGENDPLVDCQISISVCDIELSHKCTLATGHNAITESPLLHAVQKKGLRYPIIHTVALKGMGNPRLSAIFLVDCSFEITPNQLTCRTENGGAEKGPTIWLEENSVCG